MKKRALSPFRILNSEFDIARAKQSFALPGRSAFTIVEMIVVVAIIALVLGIGIPAFNSIMKEQRMSQAQQLLSGTLTRAQVIAESDATLAAVRIYPANWDRDVADTGENAVDRQMVATYTWRQTWAADQDDISEVKFAERFERVEDGPTQLLPPSTWIAPSEALDENTIVYRASSSTRLGDLVLDGEIGTFALNADRTDPQNGAEQLLDADDFLIVFDPEHGVIDGHRYRSWAIKGFDPRPSGTETGQLETDGWRNGGEFSSARYMFKRIGFSGIITYDRDAYRAVAGTASNGDLDVLAVRRDALRRFGRMHYVNPTGGGLIKGSEEE